MKELQKLLKEVTGSKNYYIENSCGYRLYYTGKDIPCGCVQYGKEQIAYVNTYNEMKHLLIILGKFRKHTTISTKNYIESMGYLFGQIQSHLAYGYSFEGSRYIGEINLPYSLKLDVYNYMKSLVSENGYAGNDSEGNSYNYLKLVEA
jgi:hypothetical protein